MVIVILSLALLLQFSAALLAVSMSGLTGRRRAWIAMAAALFLMAVRQSITVVRLVMGDAAQTPDLTMEIVSLSASALLVVGLAWMAPGVNAVKGSEQALRESEETFLRAFRATPEAVTIATLDEGRFIEVNDGFVELSGYARPEAIGRTALEMNIWADAADRAHMAALLQTEGRVRDLEFGFRVKSGAVRLCEFSADLIEIKGRPCILAHTKDISARKQAEEEKRRLSLRLVQAQEAERRRIAQDLHDEVGGLLTALEIALQMGSRQQREAQPALEEAKQLVGMLTEEIRRTILDLHPNLLDDLGLVPELRRLFERYTNQTDVAVDFGHDFPASTRFAPPLEIAVYRIIQEALTNVARHAGVDAVQVVLYREPAALVVHVIDEGQGFDREATRAQRSTLGLSGMEERATLLGGSLAVETAPGAGTRVSVTLPLG